MRQFYTVSGEKVSENPVTGNTVAVKTEQGWSRAKVLSSKAMAKKEEEEILEIHFLEENRFKDDTEAQAMSSSLHTEESNQLVLSTQGSKIKLNFQDAEMIMQGIPLPWGLQERVQMSFLWAHSSSWSQSFLRKMLCFQCESKDAISQRVTVHRKAGETPKQHDCYRDEEEDDLRHQRKLGSQGLSSNGRSPGTTGTQGCQVGPVG